MTLQSVFSLFISLGFIGFYGCAGKSVVGVEEIDEEKELPKHLVEKFRVEEIEGAQAATPAENSDPVKASKESEPKKSKEIEKTAEAQKKPPEKAKTQKKQLKGPTKKGKELVAASQFAYPQRKPSTFPFQMAEKLSYEVTYFGVVAGILDIEVLPFKEINGRKVIHLHGHVKSSAISSLFYKLDDHVHSYFDYDGMFSHRFELYLNESKQQRSSLELYDSEKGTVYYWDRWHHHKKGYKEKEVTHEIPRFPQDVLSAIYYVRTLPIETKKSFEFPVVAESKPHLVNLSYVRREKIKSHEGKIWATVVKPDEIKQKNVKKKIKKNDFLMWFSEGKERYLLRLEAKVKIGSVTAQLKEVVKGVPIQ